jgi:hypothetical protein
MIARDCLAENTLLGGANVRVCARLPREGFPATTAFFGRQTTSPISNIDLVVALFAVSNDFIDTATLSAIRLQESLRTTVYDT